MIGTLEFFGALLLFLIGLRLSAFFSGSETGFYRVSFLRLAVEAQTGDSIAKRLLWFTRHPSYFVATTLVGNNVANYVTTLAIGFGVTVCFSSDSGWLEIVVTLLVAPLIFITAELIPKNLYYRAPLMLLRRDARWFNFFYYLFLPVSFPLVGITKLMERFGRSESRGFELVLGRKRLVQVLSQGHREGILTDVQNRMVNGLLQTASQPVHQSATPTARILGVPNDASRDLILDYAQRYGLSHVPVRFADSEKTKNANDWFGYLSIADLRIVKQSVESLIRPLPTISQHSSKLEALLILRHAGEALGIVTDNEKQAADFSASDSTVANDSIEENQQTQQEPTNDERADVIGLISERGLIEQLFRPPSAGSATSGSGETVVSGSDAGHSSSASADV